MNAELADHLAPVVDAVDRAAPPITMTEITRDRTVPTPAPPIPRTPRPTESGPRREVRPRRTLAVAAATGVAVVAGLLIISSRHDSADGPTVGDTAQTTPESTAINPPPSPTAPSVVNSPSTTVTQTAAETITIPFTNDTVITPTLLVPQALPAGLEFLQGGTVETSGGPSVDLWTPDLERWYTIDWAPDSMFCGQTTITMPGGPIAADVEEAISQRQADTANSDAQQLLEWCDGDTTIWIDARQADPDEMADLARSITISDDGDHATFEIPNGFSYRIGILRARNAALVYGNGDTRLRVLSFASTDGDFEVLQRGKRDVAELATHPIEPFEINGRPALWNQDTQIAVFYDAHTMAYVDGTGLSDQQLLEVAASLAPGDTALAPPLTGDCEVLQICG
ncbi:MAG: hypothetical protein JWN99_1676 [Ilumatobacteraceae bacterium]|nr:hypothetical protein [Ilumatobacteraceae bacterium]